MVLSSPPKFVSVENYFLFDGTEWVDFVVFPRRCSWDQVYMTKHLNEEELQEKYESYKEVLAEHPLTFFFYIMRTDATESWYCNAEKDRK